MNIKRFINILLMCFLLVFSTVMPVLAAAVTNGNIVSFTDAEVPADATVENVIVVGGNAIIAGNVKDEVVVVNGNAILTSTAYIRDHVIVLGGDLRAESGAYVGKGVFRFGGNFDLAATLMGAGIVILALWMFKLFLTLSLIIIPVLFAWAWPVGVEEVGEIIGAGPTKAAVAGIFGGLAAIILIIFLAMTIIGLPVAVIAGLLVLVTIAAGLGGVSLAIGQNLPLNITPGNAKPVTGTLLGAVLIALVFNVPVFGIIALTGACATAFGGMLMKWFTKKE
ncbi:hypothetical protein TcarDRAFT_2453 [Thermosinus carboxydivorans Nor1]|uniref:Uncharacterized protein n=1 Tax=Thermosinus carboxydivorans Nor1 TaxID=401526 RepID=A1HLQ7_9FIRM|nr:hypothetical protein [Thermosinus carboxydivorans]EAX48764.1 hypothetical protein TcarDRAFT_2453 [Thermosinus carboxydivorans Nor1]